MLKGFIFEYQDGDREAWLPNISDADQAAILAILEKYETSNAMFEASIRGNLTIIDKDDNENTLNL